MADVLEERGTGLVYVDAFVGTRADERYDEARPEFVWPMPDHHPRQALLACPFGCTVMWRRDVHGALGLFDEGLEMVGDYAFFLRVALARGAFHLARPLTLYHVDPGSLSQRDTDGRVHELARFLPLLRRTVDMAVLYPFLASDSGPAARSAAHTDLANWLLDPWGIPGPQEAEFHYRRAMEWVGSRPYLLWNLSAALRAQGRGDEAEASRALAVRGNPSLGEREGVLRVAHAGVDALPPVRFYRYVSVEEYERMWVLGRPSSQALSGG
jgi:hypothetical protein